MPHKLKFVNLPERMSKALAELIGIHFGDGCLHKDSKYDYTILYVGNSKTDKEYMDYILELLFELFSIKAKTLKDKKKNCITIRIRSKRLFYFYKNQLGICDGPKKDLHIPNYIKENKKFLYSFLRGLFDTDGCVTYQRNGKYCYLLIKICTKHKNFAEEISYYLNQLGIPAYITIKRYKQFVGYDVVVRNKNVKKFFKIIGSKNNRNLTKFHNYKWGH